MNSNENKKYNKLKDNLNVKYILINIKFQDNMHYLK